MQNVTISSISRKSLGLTLVVIFDILRYIQPKWRNWIYLHIRLPKWRNWQTRTTQNRVPSGMWVRFPPSALHEFMSSCIFGSFFLWGKLYATHLLETYPTNPFLVNSLFTQLNYQRAVCLKITEHIPKKTILQFIQIILHQQIPMTWD